MPSAQHDARMVAVFGLAVGQQQAELKAVAEARLYRDAGFPHATISYQVSPSGNRPNTFDIDFDIAEGAPVLVGSVAFTDSAGGPLNPPAPLRAGYEDRLRLARRLVGTRLSAATLSRLEGRMAGWWRDRGFPLAEARAAVEVDSAGDRADLRLAMTPGPPARVSEVRVEGLVALHPNVIRREMPFRPDLIYKPIYEKFGAGVA